MKKTKFKKLIRKFLYLKEARKNTLLNFRNNIKVTGCYITMQYVYPSPAFGNKSIQSIAIPFRFKTKFAVGDVIFLNQRVRFTYTRTFAPVDCRKKEKLYFKILGVEAQETWDGPNGPYYVVFLGIKKLDNLEFLAAMNELKKGKKK